MCHEYLHTSLLQGINHTRAVVSYFIARVRCIGISLHQSPAGLLAIKAEQQPDGFIGRQKTQFIGVLYIHYLVANVIGGLYKKNQRMAHTTQTAVGLLPQRHAQFLGNAHVNAGFRLKKAELALARRSGRGGEGILHDGSQGTVSHHVTAAAPAFELMREQAEGVGVTVEAGNVGPLHIIQALAVSRDVLLQTGAGSFRKIRTYGPFATVAERRVAQVMGQTSRRNNGSQRLNV